MRTCPQRAKNDTECMGCLQVADGLRSHSFGCLVHLQPAAARAPGLAPLEFAGLSPKVAPPPRPRAAHDTPKSDTVTACFPI
jgi:hypothetical protein